MSSTQVYVDQQLGATGFVLCEPSIAFQIRPDLWSVLANCRTDFGPEVRKILANRAPVLFTFEGDGPQGYVQGYGGCFSQRRLEDRILELYGIELTAKIVESLPMPQAPNQQASSVLIAQSDDPQVLRALAAEELPTHECHKRREILSARQKIGGVQ